jgi:hypothetical protein
MNTARKRTVLVLMAILVGGTYFMLRHASSPNEQKTSPPANGSITPPPPKDAVTADELSSTSSAEGSSTDASALSAEKKRAEEMRRALQEMNVSIAFWGVVVDQDNRPVGDAKVLGHVRIWGEAGGSNSLTAFPKLEARTGPDGRFDLQGLVGDCLTIEAIDKEGYELSRQARRSYLYNGPTYFTPSAQNPVVFKLWKKLGAEPLVHASKFYGIIPDGRAYSIDFLEKQKQEGRTGGDLIVQITRDKPAGQAKYDWSFSIEGIGGGVIESTNEFMFLAPENGYQERYGFAMAAGQTNWAGRITKSFFVRSRNGQVHTRMVAEVFSDYRDQAVFKVEYFSNPAGSRVLEYDPLQGLIQPQK